MTEREAIKVLKNYLNEQKDHFSEWQRYSPEKELWKEKIVILEAFQTAISTLKEIQQYREIGTVEKCREAVKKQKPKKPKLNYKSKFFGKATYTCPRCGNYCLKEFSNERQNNRYCWDCGQKIDFGGVYEIHK